LSGSTADLNRCIRRVNIVYRREDIRDRSATRSWIIKGAGIYIGGIRTVSRPADNIVVAIDKAEAHTPVIAAGGRENVASTVYTAVNRIYRSDGAGKNQRSGYACGGHRRSDCQSKWRIGNRAAVQTESDNIVTGGNRAAGYMEHTFRLAGCLHSTGLPIHHT